MATWQMFENEEHKYVAVDAKLAKVSEQAFGEPCFGGSVVPEALVKHLLRRFGGYSFDSSGLKVHAAVPVPAMAKPSGL